MEKTKNHLMFLTYLVTMELSMLGWFQTYTKICSCSFCKDLMFYCLRLCMMTLMAEPMQLKEGLIFAPFLLTPSVQKRRILRVPPALPICPGRRGPRARAWSPIRNRRLGNLCAPQAWASPKANLAWAVAWVC